MCNKSQCIHLYEDTWYKSSSYYTKTSWKIKKNDWEAWSIYEMLLGDWGRENRGMGTCGMNYACNLGPTWYRWQSCSSFGPTITFVLFNMYLSRQAKLSLLLHHGLMMISGAAAGNRSHHLLGYADYILLVMLGTRVSGNMLLLILHCLSLISSTFF